MKQQKELEDALFPQSGIVNWNFYEQTLLGNPMSSVMDEETPHCKGIEQMVLSEDEVEEIPYPVPFKPGKEKAISDKETNSGTVQKKGNVM